MYPFILLIIKYKGFTLLIFMYLWSLTITYSIQKVRMFCMMFYQSLIYLDLLNLDL